MNTDSERVIQQHILGGSPYALEVSVDNIRTVKIFNPLRTVDKLTV